MITHDAAGIRWGASARTLSVLTGLHCSDELLLGLPSPSSVIRGSVCLPQLSCWFAVWISWDDLWHTFYLVFAWWSLVVSCSCHHPALLTYHEVHRTVSCRWTCVVATLSSWVHSFREQHFSCHSLMWRTATIPLLTTVLLIQLRMQLIAFVVRENYWILLTLLSSSTSRCFSTRLFS